MIQLIVNAFVEKDKIFPAMIFSFPCLIRFPERSARPGRPPACRLLRGYSIRVTPPPRNLQQTLLAG